MDPLMYMMYHVVFLCLSLSSLILIWTHTFNTYEERDRHKNTNMIHYVGFEHERIHSPMTEPSSSPSFKIIEVCSFEPLNGTTSCTVPTSLPLTFFDLLWLRFPPVERLFFYSFPHDSSSFFHSVLPNLKHSLSLTLRHFLPLAGNLTWSRDSPKPTITYNPGDSVSFTVSESHIGNFNILCSNLCEASQRHRLVPRLNTCDEKASLLALQVTFFPNNGFCIGITTHHAVLDGKSSTLFMKSWAYICSNLNQAPSLSLPENLTPFFDRSVIKDPTGIDKTYANAWLNHGGENNRSLKVWDSIRSMQSDAMKGLFELTPIHIQKLKEYANSKMKNKVQLSTFSVTCAYVLACLVKAEQPKDERVFFAFSVDCRLRLDPPIPGTYFGNCVAGQGSLIDTKSLVEKDGFVSALEGISEALNRVKDGVLKGAENWVSSMIISSGSLGKLFSMAGSPWFEVYSIDFGWGRPKKVDMTSTDRTGAFSLSESRNSNGGIEIGLALNKPVMEAFSALFAQGLESL